MRVGRVYLEGPQVWPDQLLETGVALVGFVLCLGRLYFGFELNRSRDRKLVWINLYVGWWAFDVCVDPAGVLGDD